MAAIEEVNRLRLEHIAIDNTPTGPFPFEETRKAQTSLSQEITMDVERQTRSWILPCSKTHRESPYDIVEGHIDGVIDVLNKMSKKTGCSARPT